MTSSAAALPAWFSEPCPITDPRHPTGVGTEAGRLVVGWPGEGREFHIVLDELSDISAVEDLLADLRRRGGPGMTGPKLAFLEGILRRRLG